MTVNPQPSLLIIGVGGLGRCMVIEALERGLPVSVLVRDRDKLVDQLGAATVSRLTAVTVGDATDAGTIDIALQGIDVVLSGRGADPAVARSLADAAARNSTGKICWPAGTTNVLADDGETPNYRILLAQWPVAEEVFRTHQACIDAISGSGVNAVFFCPGRMGPAGHRSAGVKGTVVIDRAGGPFVSYEDAAWVMVEAAVTDQWDGLRISAASPTRPPS